VKINNIGSFHTNPYKKQAEKQETLEKTLKKDKLEISNEAKELADNKIIAERQAKVEALKAQVQAGEYKVNPEEVSERLVDYFQKMR
jgi:negative regulator of flagellin synthesis FlgM